MNSRYPNIYREFVYAVSAVFLLPLWPEMDVGWRIFARDARITLRSPQQSGAECYGTSADDRNATSGFNGK